MPHSILFAESCLNQTHKESHNRYAILINDIDTVSIALSNEDGDTTESSTDAPPASSKEQQCQELHGSTHDASSTTQENDKKDNKGALIDKTSKASKGSLEANHLTSSALRMKVPGDKPPTIVVPIITAAHRLDGAGEPGPNSPSEVSSQHEQVAP
ncbi:hypothetical protein ARMSODRAFT_1024685 [Armillaria solidipes]|uniref:Uncharacterized protein n=1 Tax=Armillaria solidipes TaxID=1076256 RepID=A0A2H3BDN0_9AGAR|nr:hypothetical protein ARMSODRAFT_1024685 [Armillaria solidipes]